MKKILTIFTFFYLVLIGIIFYIFFGVGIFTNTESLKWQDFQIMVPADFKTQTYESKGWDVYYLKKMTIQIKIATKSPAININRLPKQSRGKIIFQSPQGEDGIYYIINPYKVYEVVYALNIDGVTLYLSVKSPSVFSAVYLLEKISTDFHFKGIPIDKPNPQIPVKAYITDLIMIIGMLIPFLLVIILFSLSGRKPSGKYFQGDPIRLEESNVYFTRVQRLKRKGTFCYLALTVTRLMVFVFKKPVVEIKLNQEKPDITFQGKKIIIRKCNEKFFLKPADIKKWKNELNPYIN